MSREYGETVTILLADDDEEDRDLIREALRELDVPGELRWVADGRELLDYLRGRGKYGGRSADAPRPAIILLDLNMPRMDGREVLAELKSDPDLCSIPVVVLTTSQHEADVVASYQLGVNSFMTKPVTFLGLVDALQAWQKYWFELVELPSDADM